MIATLVIPRPPVEVPGGPTINSRAVYRWKLRWTDHHPASQHGLGVLLSPNNEVVDGFFFRFLRDQINAWLETDDPERVAGALGLPPGEAGIRRKHEAG